MFLKRFVRLGSFDSFRPSHNENSRIASLTNIIKCNQQLSTDAQPDNFHANYVCSNFEDRWIFQGISLVATCQFSNLSLSMLQISPVATWRFPRRQKFLGLEVSWRIANFSDFINFLQLWKKSIDHWYRNLTFNRVLSKTYKQWPVCNNTNCTTVQCKNSHYMATWKNFLCDTQCRRSLGWSPSPTITAKEVEEFGREWGNREKILP